MTATCRLLLGRGAIFLLGLDSSAPLPPPPPPPPGPLFPRATTTHPRPRCHTTQHTSRCGAPRPAWGAVPFGLGFQRPLTHTRTHTAPDKANPQPCRTLPPAVSPHPVVGTLLTGLWVWGGSLPHSSLWLPTEGPGRASLALKGAPSPIS